ncbi:MAG: hypothetical protein JW852_00075 [Spirochaetales bacterium]|nr:hypothetical protein [Spirochaetales bacterium]
MKIFCFTLAVFLLVSCAGIQDAVDETAPAAEAPAVELEAEAAPGDRDVEQGNAAGEAQVPPGTEGGGAAPEEVAAAEGAPAGDGLAGSAVADRPTSAQVDSVTADRAPDSAADEKPPADTATDDTAAAAAAIAVEGPAVEDPAVNEPAAAAAAAEVAEAATAEAAVVTETLREPPPPLPDPLNGRQIDRLVFSEIGEGLLPVHRSGSAVYLLHDIDGNGYSDVFALAVRVDRREAAEFTNINDYTRLYRAERDPAKFYLRLFYQRNGTLVPADLVSLGERMVVDSFYPQAIVEGKNIPFAVSIVFTTEQGRVREWVIFTGGKPGRFSIQERTGELPRVEDIDNDGVIDVVIYEEIYEIGIGNETYMTWYSWDGADFARRKAVNIVRNLREFLKAVFDTICERDWYTFSDRGLSMEMRARAPDVDYSDFDVFHHVFTLATVEESFKNQAITEEQTIKRAVYPEITENPFSQRDGAGFFFPLSVRFETSSGRNHLYTVRVYMLPNPFGERQFAFAIEEI